MTDCTAAGIFIHVDRSKGGVELSIIPTDVYFEFYGTGYINERNFYVDIDKSLMAIQVLSSYLQE